MRFPLSLRNVEDLLHERGIEVSHETIRFWWNRFGPIFAAELRKKRKGRMRALLGWRWHLDEVFVKINGERHYLWRAVDQEGEVLEAFVSKKRDRKAALKFLRKLMKRYPRPDAIITDRLRSYRAALRELGGSGRHQAGRWLNNRAENSHLPFRQREHAMLRFRRMRSLQQFAAVHSSVYNHFTLRQSLCSRDNFKLNRAAELAKWRQLWAPNSLSPVENSDLLISSDSAIYHNRVPPDDILEVGRFPDIHADPTTDPLRGLGEIYRWLLRPEPSWDSALPLGTSAKAIARPMQMPLPIPVTTSWWA